MGTHLGIDSQHLHAYVVGEHGDSEVLCRSSVTVAGLPLEDVACIRNVPLTDVIHKDIDERVRRAAYRIIQGKGATYYGIGSALARIVDVVLHDQRSIMTVCAPAAEIEGVPDVTLAMPRLVGGQGVLATMPLSLDDVERTALQRSATTLKSAIESLPQ